MNIVLRKLLLLASKPAEESLPEELHECLREATLTLGFNLFSLGHQQGLPMSSPRFTWVSNYPKSWTEHYLKTGYLKIDPRFERAKQGKVLFMWDEALFAKHAQLWEDLKAHDLHQGFSLTITDQQPGFSILSLVRVGGGALCEEEIKEKQSHLQCLAKLSHDIVRSLVLKQQLKKLPSLTEREVEVFQWTADGKSAQDIADILELSKNTVDFHIKNTVKKLNVPNKTAAVLRAAFWGLL
ncbi:MAG: autoinducer binding domain-containing protein [Lautropia sp.]|nr:autoinducer binding domain-containing protein [Lautropia sp.]